MCALLVIIAGSFVSCNDVDNLDDQAPALVVKIDNPDSLPISAANKVYIVYYADEDWANPYLQHGTGNTTIITPTVTSMSVYIAVFYDTDGNGVLDPGEPCTGYGDASHSTLPLPDPIHKLTFFPLEWRIINMTLTLARVY